MRRLQLFEFEDQPWLPTAIRDFMTDYLRVVFATLSSRVALEAPLLELMEAGGTDRIVDLASGGGGPVLEVRRRLEASSGRKTEVLLTDKYPNQVALGAIPSTGEDAVEYHPCPVDARHVPADLHGVRTLFTAFHHFPPHEARRILADAVDRRRPIAVFESTERTSRMLLVTLLVPLLVGISTLTIRPIRASRWCLTFLLPLIPLLSLWDGLVSCLRSYTQAELDKLAAGVDANHWTWRSGRLPVAGLPFRVTYLIGFPTGGASLARTGSDEGETLS